nr:alkylated DNA repair protein AlkB homolog 8 [Tanacetum cinerariifolium]
MTQSGEVKQSVESRLGVQLATCLGEIKVMTEQKFDDNKAINLKKMSVRSLIESFPKRQTAVTESRYSCQLEETETLCFANHITSRVATNEKQAEANILVYLTPGSLLLISGEARYLWKHEFNRKPSFQNLDGLEINRKRRTSITLKKLCNSE